MYGIVSDLYPIRGRHQSPYILLSSVLGIISFTCLGVGYITNSFTAALALFGTALSQAIPDVMVDGNVAWRSKTNPYYAADLQVGKCS